MPQERTHDPKFEIGFFESLLRLSPNTANRSSKSYMNNQPISARMGSRIGRL